MTGQEAKCAWDVKADRANWLARQGASSEILLDGLPIHHQHATQLGGLAGHPLSSTPMLSDLEGNAA